MKKFVLSLLTLAATMNIMAVTYSAKATITLESKANYESCQIIIGESDALAEGITNGEAAELNMEGRSVALYVDYDGVKYQNFASNPATMKNLALGVKTNAASEYNLYISDVTGSFTLKIGDAEPFVVTAGTQVITLTPNQTAAAFGLINPDYVFMKGDFDAPDAGNEWISSDDFTKNGATASLEMSLVADAWYHFQIVVNGATGANGSAFDKDHKSYEVPTTGFGTQMTLHTDAAGTYTFTWTYATNTLEIGFPAVAPVYDAQVKTNANGLATFSYNADLQAVESDVKLYKGDLNGNVLDLAEVNYVKANEGVIVYGAANTTYHFNVGTGTSDFTGNELLPASAWDYAAQDGYSIYVLSGTMLYLYEGTDMKPNKAFLKVNQNPISGNAPARISMRFNGTQDVENAEAEDAKAVKFVENGEIFIRRGNEVYNLQGQIVK